MAIEWQFGPSDGQTLLAPLGEARAEWVESSSGLRLRVTAGGARAWYATFYAPAAGATRRLKLGNAAKLPLAKARRLARAALAAVEAGRDPFLERREARQTERAARVERSEERRRRRSSRPASTVLQLTRAYVEHRRTVPSGRFGRVARPQTLLLWESMNRLHVETMPLGALAVDRVTPEDVLLALEAAVRRSGPTMGPRVRDFLSAAWKWAALRPHSVGAQVAPINFAALEKVGRVQQERERVLAPGEIWSLWRAADREGLEGEALRFSLLTACRVREASDLPWSEVDLDARTWTLAEGRSKNHRARAIPLSEPAVALLERLQPRTEATGYVFGASHVRVSEASARIRKAMGGEPWQPRDLRRTAATLCARLGAEPRRHFASAGSREA